MKTDPYGIMDHMVKPGYIEHQCSICHEIKPESEYYFFTTGGRKRRRAECKQCYKTRGQRERRRLTPEERLMAGQAKHLRRYGLTVDEYNAMWDERGGRCDICGRADKALHVDHDHETGKVRGLLCFGCNVALGHLRHSIAFLRKAIRYLRETA